MRLIFSNVEAKVLLHASKRFSGRCDSSFSSSLRQQLTNRQREQPRQKCPVSRSTVLDGPDEALEGWRTALVVVQPAGEAPADGEAYEDPFLPTTSLFAFQYENAEKVLE
jgi:hypothetical protein